MKLVGGKCLFVIKTDVEMNKLLKIGLHLKSSFPKRYKSILIVFMKF